MFLPGKQLASFPRICRSLQNFDRCILSSRTSSRQTPNGAVSSGREVRRCYHELSYAHYGEPYDVLKYHQDSQIVDDPPMDGDADENDISPDSEMVQIEMLHVPWNPADVNILQGRYENPYSSAPSSHRRPSAHSMHFPGQTVAGNEGWATVVASQSQSLPEGSLVTVAKPGLGTLRSSLWVSEDSLLRVPEDLYEHLGPAGSTLFQLGGTAIRMLSDFQSKCKDDSMITIQNAGNSGVGLMVSQLAPLILGGPCVSLVRRGNRTTEEFASMIDYLTTTGKNALVVAEEDLIRDDTTKVYRKEVEDKVRSLSSSGDELADLALNAVGGTSVASLLRLLRPGASVVTYGGMSGKAVQAATPQLIFQDLRLVGYWHSRWMTHTSKQEKQSMVDALAKYAMENDLECPPVKVFPLSEVKEGLRWQAHQTGAIRSKLVFDCQL